MAFGEEKFNYIGFRARYLKIRWRFSVCDQRPLLTCPLTRNP